jgi:HK97 family phage major capsid protein
MPEEKDKKTVEQLAEGINKSIEDLKKSINDKADLNALETRFTAITQKLDKLIDKDGKFINPEYVAKQQTQLDEISTQLKQLGEHQTKNAKPMRLQILEQVKSKDFQDKVKAYSGRGELVGFEMAHPKAANIDTDDINAGAIETQTDLGVAAAPWRNTPIFDNIVKGIVGQGRDSISWWEETTRTDSAEMVSEQAAPAAGSAKTWTKQSMDIKMLKDYTKVSKSALEDFEYITSEVNDLITNGIPRLREVQLLEGTGLTVYLKGITGYAKTFAKPANFTALPHPNEGDVLAAAILQCQNGNTADTNKRGFNPNLILLNPGDSVNMKLLKNSIYSYLQHPLLSPDGSLFEGVRIATSLDLDAGQFIVGDFSRAKAYLKRNMRISFHYENEDDVLKDLVLVLASERIAGLKVSTPEAYAFVTGTFAAGKPLIEEVVG